MAVSTLLLGVTAFTVARRALILNCDLFEANPGLASAPYRIQSPVPESAVRLLIDAIEGRAITIDASNADFLSMLSEEFGYRALTSTVTSVQAARDHALRARIAALEERVSALAQDCPSSGDDELLIRLAAVEERVATFHGRPAGELGGRLSALESRVSSQESRISALEATLGSQPSFADIVPRAPSPPGVLPSVILPEIPPLFAGFATKRFRLLWRGSHDGFHKRAFHARCDGHGNTLLIIRDRGDNIFGAYTPVVWESRTWNGADGLENNCLKADDSGESFLYTIKNPHSFPPRKFPLRADKKLFAVGACLSGPFFGYAPPDLSVAGNATGELKSYTHGFGTTYTNDSGMDGRTFFTGSRYFTVHEIEMFEVIE
jgi:hypothetical protein